MTSLYQLITQIKVYSKDELKIFRGSELLIDIVI